MATYTGTALSAPIPGIGWRLARNFVGTSARVAAVVTLYYRATDGSRGSTTSAASLPVGAVVERTVTS